MLVQLISPTVFTALAFIVTCLLSFSTGTSAGSIAIMMPVLLPMALSLNVSIPLITEPSQAARCSETTLPRFLIPR